MHGFNPRDGSSAGFCAARRTPPGSFGQTRIKTSRLSIPYLNVIVDGRRPDVIASTFESAPSPGSRRRRRRIGPLPRRQQIEFLKRD
jgi:hypothetical protein